MKPSKQMPLGKIDVPGLNATHNVGVMGGFTTTGYLVKKGTPQGDGAKLNIMPPGMDIDDQDIYDGREMPRKDVTSTGYPGDGWQD